MSSSTCAPLRAVFMGTPAFAARILKKVLDSDVVQIAAVYTQPDRPAGRGKQLKMPEVKELALERGLPVFQPLNFKDTQEGDAAFEGLRALAPDVLLVAAYGLILPQRVLDIPAKMPINVHGSLLPKYRGAAPVQRVIMDGEPLSGVTIMRMEKGLDTGAILMQRAVGIDFNQTAGEYMDELAEEGGELLVDALKRLGAGTLKAIPQDEAKATYAAKLDKEESLLDLSLPVNTLHARIRGLSPWPGAGLVLKRPGAEDLRVSVEHGLFPETGPLPDKAEMPDDSPIGSFKTGDPSGPCRDCLLIRCGNGWYAFPSLRPAGKKAMSGRDFYNGYLKNAPAATW